MKVHDDIIYRYDSILSAITDRIECEPDPGTSFPHLRWMLNEIPKHEDEFKQHRWLAFVQGVMIERRILSVPMERDFTRPYFK